MNRYNEASLKVTDLKTKLRNAEAELEKCHQSIKLINKDDVKITLFVQDQRIHQHP